LQHTTDFVYLAWSTCAAVSNNNVTVRSHNTHISLSNTSLKMVEKWSKLALVSPHVCILLYLITVQLLQHMYGNIAHISTFTPAQRC